jgi:broad specificity phosphatase PhoE
MSTHVLLLRHGESEWNADGRWAGQADPPLSSRGRRQADHAAGQLPAIDRLVHSDLRRAVETATRVTAGAELADPALIEPAFRERRAGEWEGLTKEEIEKAWPGFLDQSLRPPGFEDDASLLTRTTEALIGLGRRHRGQRVLVVCHGGVIRAHERRHGAPDERVPNLGGRWLQVDGHDLVLGERVILLGEDELTCPPEV